MKTLLDGKRVLLTDADSLVGSAVAGVLRAGRHATAVDAAATPAAALADPATVAALYAKHRPDVVIHTAEVGGGIAAHRRHPGLHFHANAAMALNLIEEARKAGVGRFVFVGTADSYPGDAPVPMRERDLWAGLPDASHASYGIAKRVAATMLAAYRAEYGMSGAYLLLTNVYGPGADFDPAGSQVVAAMVRRFVDAADTGAETVTCWGTGTATRDFLYVDAAAAAVAAAADRYDSPEPLNIGSGVEVSIREIAELAASAAGYFGRIEWDACRPDGVARRSLDVSRARELLGFVPEVALAEGIGRTVAWWTSQRARA